MGRHETSFVVFKQVQALEAVKEQLRIVFNGEPDQEALLSAAESETDLLEAIDRLLLEEEEYEASIEKLTKQIKNFEARRSVTEIRKEKLRGVLAMAMDAIEQTTLKRPYGTVSRVPIAADINVVDAKKVETKYWVFPEPQPPTGSVNTAMLKTDAIAVHKARLALSEAIRKPYEGEIESAMAIPDQEARVARLLEIEAMMKPDMDLMLADNPLPDGVEIREASLTLRILRTKASK